MRIADGTMSFGRVLSLVGGLALVAAYYMPWFGTQGIVLTGSFLNQFLGGTGDLRRFMPGASGGPTEVLLLRTLVLLFPVSGGLAAAFALIGALRPTLRRPVSLALVVSALIPLVAVLLGTTRLPPGSSFEVGLWLIGAGALAVLLGVVWDDRRAGRLGALADMTIESRSY